MNPDKPDDNQPVIAAPPSPPVENAPRGGYLNHVATMVTKVQDNQHIDYRVRNSLSALIIIVPVAVILLVLELLPIPPTGKIIVAAIFAVLLIVSCVVIAIKYSKQDPLS